MRESARRRELKRRDTQISEKNEKAAIQRRKELKKIAAADGAMTVNLELAFLKDKIFVVMMAFDLRLI